MAYIGFIIFGLFVGVVARLLLPGRQRLSVLATLALGVVGALIGGFVAQLLGTGTWREMDWIGGIVAIATAMVLIGAAEGASAKNKTHA